MLPTINGKDLLECKKDDLCALVNNPDFKERKNK